MEMKEMEDDFKWIHPKMIIIDHKLFIFYFRHIGFFDKRKIIINYNTLYNKCSFNLRVRRSALVINGVEMKLNPKARENNLKYPGREKKGLPIILDVSDEKMISCKIELDIYKDVPRKFLVKVVLKIEYYFKSRNYRIVEAKAIEMN